MVLCIAFETICIEDGIALTTLWPFQTKCSTISCDKETTSMRNGKKILSVNTIELNRIAPRHCEYIFCKNAGVFCRQHSTNKQLFVFLHFTNWYNVFVYIFFSTETCFYHNQWLGKCCFTPVVLFLGRT